MSSDLLRMEASVYLSPHHSKRTSPVAQMIKRLSTIQETWVRSLGREDPLEKGKAAHARILVQCVRLRPGAQGFTVAPY